MTTRDDSETTAILRILAREWLRAWPRCRAPGRWIGDRFDGAGCARRLATRHDYDDSAGTRIPLCRACAAKRDARYLDPAVRVMMGTKPLPGVGRMRAVRRWLRETRRPHVAAVDAVAEEATKL